MSNLTNIPLGLLSLLSFLFFYWRQTREDFSMSEIFQSGFLMVAGFTIGSIVFVSLVPHLFNASKVFNYTGLWFWGALIGVFLSLLICVKKFEMPFYHLLEAVSLAFFVASIFITRELIYPVAGILSFYYCKLNYKSFAWYKSGRLGFAGFASLGVFFLLRGLLALIPVTVLAFTGIGKVDVVISACVSFLCFFSVYNLS